MANSISEGLAWQKTLADRRAELVKLRDKSAVRSFQATGYGADAINGTVIEPVYDPKELDKTIAGIAKAERLLEQAIKRANATTSIQFEIDDTVLGELV